MMTRSSLWRELGGFDGRFFAHMEEIDYCWRAALGGYSVAMVPTSCVWHLGGGTLGHESPFKLELNFRNNLLLLENNLPRTVGAPLARMRICLRRLLDWGSALVYLLSGSLPRFKAVAKGHAGYRKLRRQGRPAALGKKRVAGYQEKSLILLNLYSYEDSH